MQNDTLSRNVKDGENDLQDPSLHPDLDQKLMVSVAFDRFRVILLTYNPTNGHGQKHNLAGRGDMKKRTQPSFC